MNAQAQAVQPKLSTEIDALRPEIEKVLPAHVSPDKFMRVVLTAIAQSPDLRNADRRSLLTSCVKAATDGLVPDGREMVNSFNPRKSGGYVGSAITEAADAVSSSHFANITGQFLYTMIMKQAMAEDYVFSRIVPVQQTQFSGEKIPGIETVDLVSVAWRKAS